MSGGVAIVGTGHAGVEPADALRGRGFDDTISLARRIVAGRLPLSREQAASADFAVTTYPASA